MAILKLDVNTQTAAANLNDWGTVGQPLSEPPCQLRGTKIVAPIPNAPEIGLWECAPGAYRRQTRSAETMHIISGEATFTPDGGEPVALSQRGLKLDRRLTTRAHLLRHAGRLGRQFAPERPDPRQ